jgi:hypothetical protein
MCRHGREKPTDYDPGGLDSRSPETPAPHNCAGRPISGEGTRSKMRSEMKPLVDVMPLRALSRAWASICYTVAVLNPAFAAATVAG